MTPPLVLVVDDDPDILDAICEILDAEGYRVARARDGAEALGRVDDERPDVVLLDLMMPVMDGVAFSVELRKRPADRDVPIVVISAEANPQRVASVRAAGYLAKPFDIDALLAHVGSLAHRRGTRPAAH
jgi:CheY-like chemotaxis protein